jgi:hypothetical protein
LPDVDGGRWFVITRRPRPRRGRRDSAVDNRASMANSPRQRPRGPAKPTQASRTARSASAVVAIRARDAGSIEAVLSPQRLSLSPGSGLPHSSSHSFRNHPAPGAPLLGLPQSGYATYSNPRRARGRARHAYHAAAAFWMSRSGTTCARTWRAARPRPPR